MSEQPSRSPSVPGAPPPPTSPTGPLADDPARTNGVPPATTGATEAKSTRSQDAASTQERAQSRGERAHANAAAREKKAHAKRSWFRSEQETDRYAEGRTRTERDRFVFWTMAGLALLALAALLFAFFIWRPREVAQPVPSAPLLLQTSQANAGAASQRAVEMPTVEPPVDAVFSGYYNALGGLSLFGRPISGVVNYNGRQVQWFERARLEYFPEFNGTPYVVQSGLVGREFTDGRDFPRQQFFVSTPDLQYFPETGHAVGGRFLNFWRANGAMTVFGFPISEEFDETMPDGRVLRVQYFERARMEYHPELVGTSSETQLGHLARALYLNEARPSGVPLGPTMVPIP